MNYQEFLPSMPLRPYVKCIWVISSGESAAPANAGEILPDGSVEIVLSFADPVKHQQPGTAPGGFLERMVVGQLDRRTIVEYTGRVDLVGIRFQPTGAYRFFGTPLRELRGQIIKIDDLSGRIDRQIANRIDPAEPLTRRIAVLEQILLEQLSHVLRPDSVVDEAVGAIQHAKGQMQIAELITGLKISDRQLERRFHDRVGIGPKLLCRIMRFQHVMEIAEQSRQPSWSALAVDCGYYDQAHLIQDFQQFAGAPPARFFSEHG